MEKNFDTINNLTADQMKHLAAEHLKEMKDAITYVNRKSGGILSPDECADLELEAYLKACDRASTFNPAKGDLAGWLWTIAHNVACDLLKQKARQVRLMDGGRYDTEDGDVLRRGLDRLSRSERDQLTIVCWSAHDEALSFEERRKYRLQKECWQAAFHALSDKDQVLLYMRWDLKLSGEEMAQELHMTHVALRVALSRAVERFKAELMVRHYQDIDEWTYRYFDEDSPWGQEIDEDKTLFGGRSEANG